MGTPTGKFGRAMALVAMAMCAWLVPPVPEAKAQCGPDGFFGLCCSPVAPTLPGFPKAQLPGTSICWNACSVNNQLGVTVDWAVPIPVSCTQYVTTLTIIDNGSSLPVMTGTMTLDYTRTWDELDPSGIRHQVWRFVAKADLKNALSIPWPCQAPNCISPPGPHPTAFYYGYVDYAHDCNPGSLFENSIVLYHATDAFIHKPLLSDRPGNFHPKRSYAIVAPHTSAQPFQPLNQIAPGGPMFGEGMRDMASLVPPACFDEDFLTSGSVNVLGALCMATFSGTPKQQTLRQLRGQGACLNSSGQPGSFQSLKLSFPALPWFHLVTTSIGRWTNANVWPGQESAWVDEGPFIHRNVCTGDWFDINYGATTKDGWMILHPVLLTAMTDLADNYTKHVGTPTAFPILGSIRSTEKLIYIFLP